MKDEQVPTWWTDVVERRVPDVAGRDVSLNGNRPCSALIGFHGHSGVGKTAAALATGWPVVNFSDAIEALARGRGWDGSREGEGRLFLDQLGLDAREIIHPDVWIWAVERRIEATPGPVAIAGLRKQNECAMVRRRGGLLVKVVRPGYGPPNGHPIHADVANLTYDRLLLNSGTLAELHARTLALFHPAWNGPDSETLVTR